MSCNKPLSAYYSAVQNESGKHSLTFSRKFRYEGSDPHLSAPLEIPCGTCLGCKADQSMMWAVRAYHESQSYEQNSFITLTYDDEHLPLDGKINKRDLQLFIKRLRKKSPVPLRYIASGEYGEKTRRPHYHAIIFGKDWLEGAININEKMYTHETLAKTWGKGLVSIAPVNMATICYVCGYVMKKMGDEDTFSLMSRRPGIGHDWLDKYKDDLLRTGVAVIEGREYAIPPRYLQWEEAEFQDILKERKAYAIKQAKRRDMFDRFRAQNSRETVLKSNLDRKKETL